jgi:8-amino-3,8-dideoxy-alpha-D-manno-octulosonate transaminase
MQVDWPYEYPGAHWLDETEEGAVLDVLRSGSLFRYHGPRKPGYVEAFEAAAREFYGVRHAQAVNSGSGALITAMAALGVGPGCEVIVPAFMWVATVAAVVQANAIPVLCEVDDTFSMDPKDLEKKITPRTKLIVAVHMAGAPCDMEAILAVAGKHGIAVLEDCAQCNGGRFRGQCVGTFGRMGIFSLQINKNVTSGEGGLLVTDDEKLYNRASCAHDLGFFWSGGQPTKPDAEALTWGQGRRMSELCGAVASVQIKKLPQIIDHMRASKCRIKTMLEGTSGLAFRRLNDEDGDTGPFLILVLENDSRAVAAVEKMKQSGLKSAFRVADYGLHIYYNILSLVNKVPLSPAGNPWNLADNARSVYRYDRGTCPNSDALFARSILIPIPSCLTEDQERDAASAIKAAVIAQTSVV